MKSKYKMYINHQTMILILIGIMLFEGNYWALLPKLFMSQNPRYIIWAAMIFITAYLARFRVKYSLFLIPWVLYLLMILARNQEFAHGEYLNSERIILCILTVFVCSKSYEWILHVPKLIVCIGALNIIATIVFYVNNTVYEKFIALTYGSYQNGTANGLYGYRAGIADHYSQNGTYISIVLLVLAATLFLMEKRSKKHKLVMLSCLLSVVALLLTGKRAHLLFVIGTIILIYYIANPNQRVGKTFKLMIFLVVLLFAGSILVEYFPQLSYTFERLQNVGTDSASMNRILMWEYAVEMINDSPIFGAGWWGFRYESGIITILPDAATGCHNIYLEVLANCGIVGFVVFIAVLLSSLISNIKNIAICTTNEGIERYKRVLLAAIAIQIFCMMYGLTGNVIFDRTFHFYMVAVSANLAFTLNRKYLVSDCKILKEEKYDTL